MTFLVLTCFCSPPKRPWGALPGASPAGGRPGGAGVGGPCEPRGRTHGGGWAGQQGAGAPRCGGWRYFQQDFREFPGEFPGRFPGEFPVEFRWISMFGLVFNGRTTPMIEHGWLDNPLYRSMVFPAVKLQGGLLEPVMNQHKRFMFVRLVDPWDKSRKWRLVN